MANTVPEFLPASVAIFVLSAIAQPPESALPASELVLQVNGRVLNEDDAVACLAGMPKPLECRAEVAGGVLALSCRPLSSENRWIHQAVVKRIVEDAEAREHRRPVRRAKLLIRGPHGPSRLCPRDCVEAFERDYVIVMSYLRTGNDPSDEQEAEGIEEVITFSQSSFHTHWL